MMATYKEIFDLQLLHIYEKNEMHQGVNQKQINYFKKQLLLTEDIVQRIFVLNQLMKIHELEREQFVKWCSEEYFE